MLKGTNTGVIQLTQVLHGNPGISDQLKRRAKRLSVTKRRIWNASKLIYER